MARTTPQNTDTVAEAQTATAHGDWEGFFFATLDRDDLSEIAVNGIKGLVNQGAPVPASRSTSVRRRSWCCGRSSLGQSG
ncbi:hypothetical protein [Thiococcus pfennigii]|uniref:hypothetical protein n=1 Tax=Thiococcus pfennigii TaxID=1057 RepID=UPI001907ACFA|nr:hypothetical protein [Thiococcus pfennigii]MBK1701908.1 hypothetical protein [Thiococcus pfennigii]MBK1730996.1 hypothetical protein [Thiococcus pfennigii]